MASSKKVFLVFEEKPPKKCFSSYFGSDSALKTLDTQKFFGFVFLITHKKKLLTVKHAILAVFGCYSNIFILCVFKNTDVNDICASIVFKAESQKNKEKTNSFTPEKVK